jgi:Tfp pilus assembly protein PilO
MRLQSSLPQPNKNNNTSVLGMYASFAALVFIVFGMAGTKSNWEGIQRYRIKNKEINEQKTKVAEKKKYLTQTQQALHSISDKEEAINDMIPQGEKFDKYVEEIVAANSSYGFDVEKVNFTDTGYSISEEIADVSITFGTDKEDYDLEGLVQSLEKTPRISTIEKLSYSVIADKKTLKVDLKIYLIK